MNETVEEMKQKIELISSEADKVEGSEWGTIILDYDVPEGFISIEVDAEEVRWFTPREFDFNNEKTGIAELYPPKLRKVFE